MVYDELPSFFKNNFRITAAVDNLGCPTVQFVSTTKGAFRSTHT